MRSFFNIHPGQIIKVSVSGVAKLLGNFFAKFPDFSKIGTFLVIALLALGSTVHADVGLYKRVGLSSSVEDCRMSIGDLNGDGKIDFVFNDGRRTIKAFDHNGNLLWQKFNSSDPGVAEKYHNFTIQNYDIDLDGKDEVICFLEVNNEHHLAVIDGVTGNIQVSKKLSFPAPSGYYEQHHIAIANIRGRSVPQDIIAVHASKLKTEAFSFSNNTLTRKWYFVTDTTGYASGHHSYPYDIDNDGKDEIIAGVDVLDDDGKRLWVMPLYNISGGRDHVDSSTVADIDPNNPGKEIIVASQTGIWLFDSSGRTLWNYPTCYYDSGNSNCILPGEGAQEVSVGNYRTDVSGLEIVIYAESMGGSNTVVMYDRRGKQLISGNQKTDPRRLIGYNMDWDGDRSADEIYSRIGIFDGYFNKISNSMSWSYVQTSNTDEFPPVVADVQGDHREEILWYDTNEVIILYNAEPLAVNPLPSPNNSVVYKQRLANNNHCNAYYMDWSNLEGGGGTPVEDPLPNPPTNLRIISSN